MEEFVDIEAVTPELKKKYDEALFRLIVMASLALLKMLRLKELMQRVWRLPRAKSKRCL